MANESCIVKNDISSITIGSFDGMHIAHQALISLADEVVVIERGTASLTPGYRRTMFCDKPCAFYLLERIGDLSCKEFVSMLCRNYPALKKIVVGYDFGFGNGKEGDADTLKRLFDGEMEIVSEISIKGTAVHSGTIRMALERGDVAFAGEMLGRMYEIEGEAISGQGLGSAKLVPTLNVSVESYTIPKEGVYASMTRSEGSAWMPSVTFTGHRYSTDGEFSIESHILDFSGNIEPKTAVSILFVDRIRDNIRFSSLNDLKNRIDKDIEEARWILRE